MKVIQLKDPNSIRLEIGERFDYSYQAQFRQAYQGKPTSSTFTLDFSKTKHIDSSALGMLLLLKEYLGDKPKNIKLINCSEEIKSIFAVCHFESMFDIR